MADTPAGQASGANTGKPTASKAPSTSPSKRKPTKAKKQARSTKPTDAQRRANAANAQKSTGPRTSAGKERSASNSLRHGLYARVPHAILNGPLSEDPEEINAFITGLVDALGPRGPLEASIAHEIAGHHLRLWRLDRLEAALLNGGAVRAEQAVTMVLGDAESLEIESAWLDRTLEWLAVERDRLVGKPPPEGQPPADQPENGFRFDILAKVMRIACDNADVVGRWDQTITPDTEVEWYLVFRILLDHKFPKLEGLERWLFQHGYHLQDLMTERETTSSIRASNTLLAELDRTSEQRGRFTKQLQRAEDRYRKLQKEAEQPLWEMLERTQSGR